jgi:hypothetical protein
MKAKIALLAISLASLGACAATPVQPLMPGETSIQFAARGGIRDWYSDNDRSIYLLDRTGRWYFATFNGVCPNLRSSQTMRFNTDAAGTFDRFSSIATEYGRCQVGSVVRSPAPAAKGGPPRL